MRTVNVRLREVVEAKDTGNAVMRAQLGQNPRNSSKPPSSEGLARRAPKSLRKESGRKPSRPKGQPGARLELTARPDEMVSHEPGRCCGCGAGLSGAAVARTERRQVVDPHGQFLSRDRTCPAVTDLFGMQISPGAVTGMVRRVTSYDTNTQVTHALRCARAFRELQADQRGAIRQQRSRTGNQDE